MKIEQRLDTARDHDRAANYIYKMVFGKGADAITTKDLFLLWGLLPPGDLAVIHEDGKVMCMITVTDTAISLDYCDVRTVPRGTAMINFSRTIFSAGKCIEYTERDFVFPYVKGEIERNTKKSKKN